MGQASPVSLSGVRDRAGHLALAVPITLMVALSPGRTITSRLWIVWTLLLPTLGGLVAGVLLTRFFPDARGSGIPQVKASYAGKRGRVRLRSRRDDAALVPAYRAAPGRLGADAHPQSQGELK